jgi:hypothetical protein
METFPDTLATIHDTIRKPMSRKPPASQGQEHQEIRDCRGA